MDSQRALRATVAALVAAAASIGLLGCSSAPAEDDARGGDTAAQAAPAPVRDPEQTLWRLEGSDTSLPLDDTDVIALQRVVALHSAVTDTRSAETIADSVEQEQVYYTDLFQDRLDAQAYAAATTALYRDNNLAVEQQAVGWLESSLSEDRTRATVGFESHFAFTAASEGYLRHLDAETGTTYVQPREYSLVKADGTWLIDNIQKGALRTTSRP
jgi:hypothetical protein